MSEKKKVGKTLGDKIYDLRMSLDYSQEDIANAAKVTRQTVSKWESNRSQPKSQNLMTLCEALGIGMSYFDSKSTKDKPAETTAKETAPESEVVCDEATGGEETQEVKFNRADEIQVKETQKKNKRKLSNKSKIIITSVVLAIVLLLGIAMIVFNVLIASPSVDTPYDEVSDMAWNIKIENIGWALFSLSLAVAVIFGIVLIVNRVRIIKTNDEISGSKP